MVHRFDLCEHHKGVSVAPALHGPDVCGEDGSRLRPSLVSVLGLKSISLPGRGDASQFPEIHPLYLARDLFEEFVSFIFAHQPPPAIEFTAFFR
jgi:hypothetical protein